MLLTETILITISEIKQLYSLNGQILHKRKISPFSNFYRHSNSLCAKILFFPGAKILTKNGRFCFKGRRLVSNSNFQFQGLKKREREVERVSERERER